MTWLNKTGKVNRKCIISFKKKVKQVREKCEILWENQKFTWNHVGCRLIQIFHCYGKRDRERCFAKPVHASSFLYVCVSFHEFFQARVIYCSPLWRCHFLCLKVHSGGAQSKPREVSLSIRFCMLALLCGLHRYNHYTRGKTGKRGRQRPAEPENLPEMFGNEGKQHEKENVLTHLWHTHTHLC